MQTLKCVLEAQKSGLAALSPPSSQLVGRRSAQLDRADVRGLLYALFVVNLVMGGMLLPATSWRGTVELHTLLEVINTQLAFTAGVMALVRYYSAKSNMFLLLGSGLLGAAVLDLYHALITSSSLAGLTHSALSALIPWSGSASRVFLSLVMCATLRASKKERSRDQESAKFREGPVYLLLGACTVACFLLFTLVKLPPAYYPDFVLHRPADLLPGLLFGVALIGYLRKGQWRSDQFEHWLVLFLIASGVAHVVFMVFSRSIYDGLYFASHGAKLLGYLSG